MAAVRGIGVAVMTSRSGVGPPADAAREWAGGWRLIDSPCPPVMWGTYLVIDGDTGEWHARRAIGGHVQQQLTKEVDAVAGPAGVDWVARSLRGQATRVLEEASSDADMLVVGSRGHSTVTGLLVGSVGLHLVSHAKCPAVVVVRS
jgi:nucleotide-binding universal stress UspA family protein